MNFQKLFKFYLTLGFHNHNLLIMPSPSSSPILVLVESPAKAKSIQSYLGEDYLVQATGGHIMDLPTSGLAVDTKKEFAIQKVPIPKKIKIVKNLQKMISKSKTIIVATDPDREGEAIAFDILSLGSQGNKKWIRCGFREITPSAVKDKIQNPDDFQEKVLSSQETRRILDRLFGYLISPLLWKRIQGKLSAGRVQSVLLKWICDREEEIRRFIPEKYLTLSAVSEDLKFQWIHDKETKLPNEKFWKQLMPIIGNQVQGSHSVREEFLLLSKKNTATKQYPPPPHKTSTLQEEASKMFGFPPKKTMRIAQNLYEGIEMGGGKRMGLITYPRTDATRIGDGSISRAEKVILEKFGSKYVGSKKSSGSFTSSTSKKNGNKIQDAHEAIRPTMIEDNLDSILQKLTPDEKKIYTIIYRRFFASLTSPREGIKTECIARGFDEKWKLEDYNETFPGYMVWYPKEDRKKALNIPYQEGDSIPISEIAWEWKETEPPPRYTYARLVKKMESTGVGRPSTYAPSIEVLSERQYIVWEKKVCIPTSLGEEVNRFLKTGFSEFIQDDFTKKMEEDLDSIESGEKDKLSVLTPFYRDLQAKIQSAPVTMKEANICPTCKKGVIQKKKDKKGKIINFCSRYPECDYGEYG